MESDPDSTSQPSLLGMTDEMLHELIQQINPRTSNYQAFSLQVHSTICPRLQGVVYQDQGLYRYLLLGIFLKLQTNIPLYVMMRSLINGLNNISVTLAIPNTQSHMDAVLGTYSVLSGRILETTTVRYKLIANNVAAVIPSPNCKTLRRSMMRQNIADTIFFI